MTRSVEHGIGGDLGEERRVGSKPLGVAAEDRREIEAEAVDAGWRDQMPQGVEDEPQHRRALEGERVAGAGIVDERPSVCAWR